MTEKGDKQLPLSAKTFYIDEVDIPKNKIKRLERLIVLLGAKVEKFFTKEITYLITDHGQPADYRSRSHTTDVAVGSNPSPFAITPGNSLGTPPEAVISSSKANISRASMMVNISQQHNSRASCLSAATVSEQLVNNAKLWCIKMLQTDVALRWMDKRVVTLGLNKSRHRSADRPSRAPRYKPKMLRVPYIKVEDQSGKYRPVYRQMAGEDVPVLNSKAIFCPFESRGETAVVDKSAGSVTDPQRGETLTSSKLDTSKTEGEVAGKRKLAGKGKKPAKAKTNKTVNKGNSNTQMKKRLSFCMICKVRYEDLDQHLRSDQHMEYTADNNNYMAVDKLINSHASIQRFLNDTIKYQKEHQVEGLAHHITLVDSTIITPSVTKDGANDTAPPAVTECAVGTEALCVQDAVTTEYIHRSVSDSAGSSVPPDFTIEGEENVVVEVAGTPHDVNEQSVSKVRETELSPTTLPAALPTTSRVDIKPRLISMEQTIPKESRISASGNVSKGKATQLSKAAAEQFCETLAKAMTKINSVKSSPQPKGNQPVQPSAKSDILDSEMSPSEIVKLRKRGKKLKSPVKRKDASPRKSPGKSKAKLRQSSENVADIQAHWALLSEKQSKVVDNSYGLPLDVSYGVLNETQLENMAQQKVDVGELGKDDLSLVQSIHSYLDMNSNNNSNVDSDVDDPLLLCDSYLNQRISTQQCSRNAMMKPVTPRKSPRCSLGARDWTDEQFSPQKQRLSQSMEKSRAAAVRAVVCIPKLNLDRPVSDCKPPPVSIEDICADKENTPNVSTDDSLTVLDLVEGDNSSVFTNTTQQDEFIHELPQNSSLIHSVCNQETSVNNGASNSTSRSPTRKTLTSPKMIMDTLKPLHISTPADGRYLDEVAEPSQCITSSSTHSSSIKKSLFNAPQQQPNTSKPFVPSNERRASVQFSRSSSTTACRYNQGEDPFGFDGPAVIDVPLVKTPKRNLVRSISNSSNSKRKKRKRRPTKKDLERQSSLLSFGSTSLPQGDDVFSLPPDTTHSPFYLHSPLKQSPRNSGITVKKRGRSAPSPKSKYADLSDADLSAPGFKCSSRIRRQAKNARRTSNAGSTPGRLSKKVAAASNSISDSEQSSNVALGTELKRMCPSPRKTSTKRCRKNVQHICQDEPVIENQSFDVKHRTPPVAKQREQEELSHKDISTCSNLTSDDEEVPPLISQQSPRRLSPRRHRILPDSARDYLYKHKYDYQVSSNHQRSVKKSVTSSS